MKAENSIAHIDRYRLERDWEVQADFVKEWGDEKAEAEYKVNVLEAKLKLVSAQLSAEIRKNPGRYDIQKITEPLVESTILLQRKYRRTLSRLNKARRDLNYAKGALKALDHKRDALENLQKGDMQSFFGSPRERKTVLGVSKKHRGKKPTTRG